MRVTKRLARKTSMKPAQVSIQTMNLGASNLSQHWVDARFYVPSGLSSQHHPVSVIGVCTGHTGNAESHVDIVAYWPAVDRWTMTVILNANDGADDVPCHVTHWMPRPDLPRLSTKSPGVVSMSGTGDNTESA